MELKTFVEQSLIQIIEGIHDAQKQAHKFRAMINPPLAPEVDDKGHTKGPMYRPAAEMLQRVGLLETGMGTVADMVEFDVAITVSTGKTDSSEKGGEAKAGLNISVVSAQFGGGAKSSTQSKLEDSRISRVKFRVPVAFPKLG